MSTPRVTWSAGYYVVADNDRGHEQALCGPFEKWSTAHGIMLDISLEQPSLLGLGLRHRAMNGDWGAV